MPTKSYSSSSLNSANGTATSVGGQYINNTSSSGSGGTHNPRTPPLPVTLNGSTTPGLSGLSAASVAAALARTDSLRSQSVSPALIDPAGVMKQPAVDDARITTISWINEAYDSLLLVCVLSVSECVCLYLIVSNSMSVFASAYIFICMC